MHRPSKSAAVEAIDKAHSRNREKVRKLTAENNRLRDRLAAIERQRQVPDAEDLARAFHATYETLAPQYGYATREETREFDSDSANGKLMIAVCRVILERMRLGIGAAP